MSTDGSIILSYLGTNRNTAPVCLRQLEVVHAIGERLHLVGILREVDTQVPSEVLDLQGTGIEGNLDTLVLNLTGIDEAVSIARGGG